MDSLKLKEIYNLNYSTGTSNWAGDTLIKANKVISKILKYTSKFPSYPKIKVLDVGCAHGIYTEAFRKFGFESHGLDFSEVAIDLANKSFPNCTFHLMDGFNPKFNISFDIIFCKGFSGSNTHDLNFVISWINKYIEILNPKGYLIFSYSSNFTGTEQEKETVNWTKKEIAQFCEMVPLTKVKLFTFHYFGFISILKKRIFSLFNDSKKETFYIIFKKS